MLPKIEPLRLYFWINKMVLTRSMIKQRGIAIEAMKWEEQRKRPAGPPAAAPARGINYLSICLSMAALALAISVGLYTRSIYGFVIPAVGLQIYQMAALA